MDLQHIDLLIAALYLIEKIKSTPIIFLALDPHSKDTQFPPFLNGINQI